MPTSSSKLTTSCTPMTTPLPQSTSLCRGQTVRHQDVLQPSSCMVQGGVRCMGLCCTQNMGQRLSSWLLCHRSQVPETIFPGTTLVTLTCTDTSTDGGLHYALEGPPSSRSHFCMEGPQLKVSWAMGSAQVDSKPSSRSPVGPCDTCCHARFWVRAHHGFLLPKACSFSSLPPSALALQLCGTPWLCGILWLCRASELCRAPQLCLTLPSWPDRSTPPWTMTQRPWLLWASSSQPPLW